MIFFQQSSSKKKDEGPRYTFRFDRDLQQALELYCKSHDTTIAQLVRRTLRKEIAPFIQQQKQGQFQRQHQQQTVPQQQKAWHPADDSPSDNVGMGFDNTTGKWHQDFTTRLERMSNHR